MLRYRSKINEIKNKGIRVFFTTVFITILIYPSQVYADNGTKSFRILNENEKKNTYFEINPVNFPEVGQTFQIKKSIKISQVEIRPIMVSRVKSLDYFIEESYANDKVVNKWTDKPIKASSTVSLYKRDTSTPPGELFDLTEGFTLVHRQSFKKPIVIGKPFVLNLDKKIKLDKGVYFLVYGFQLPDKKIINIRFAAQENGSNTMGGANYDIPYTCKYKKTKDRTPGYMAYVTDSKERPRTGDFPGSVGFGTSFRMAKAKISECHKVVGVFGGINMDWNPGDLDLILRGR
jgi:hypothetical protein